MVSSPIMTTKTSPSNISSLVTPTIDRLMDREHDAKSPMTADQMSSIESAYESLMQDFVDADRKESKDVQAIGDESPFVIPSTQSFAANLKRRPNASYPPAIAYTSPATMTSSQLTSSKIYERCELRDVAYSNEIKRYNEVMQAQGCKATSYEDLLNINLNSLADNSNDTEDVGPLHAAAVSRVGVALTSAKTKLKEAVGSLPESTNSVWNSKRTIEDATGINDGNCNAKKMKMMESKRTMKLDLLEADTETNNTTIGRHSADGRLRETDGKEVDFMNAKTDKTDDEKLTEVSLEEFDMTPEELARWNRFRKERNRLAARKCRQKQKDRVGMLEETVYEIQSDNKKVEMEISSLRRELANLSYALTSHECQLRKRKSPS